MDEKTVELHLNDHDHEIAELRGRICACEEKRDTILKLTSAVHELGINMKHMLEEQRRQGERLSKLEAEPVDNARFMRRQVIGAIASGVVGTILGALLALILR